MILRKPRIEDYTFVYECYQDWPLTSRGPVTLQKAVDWVRRWIARSDELCLVLDDGGPRGLIMYQLPSYPLNGMCAVHNIVVHPNHRGNGYANWMVKMLRDKLVAEGITCARFKAISGPIADQIHRGKFRKLGEEDGETGTLVLGELTPEMEV